MAKLRTAMDASFWDLNISTPLAIDGVSKSIPGDPIPVDGARASKALRIQQLAVLGNGFPLGIIPSYSPSPSPQRKDLGSLALQSLLARKDAGNWWGGLVGQFRPKKLITSIKNEITTAEEWELPLIKDVAKHILNTSLYAVGLCSQIALSSSSSLLLSLEKHGERKRPCTKAMLFHKLPDHDINLEAAWPELFVDHKGKYWEVPGSVSLDCSSLISESGLRYRFGVHTNSGQPEALDPINNEIPPALLPGICAKAAVSYEKSKDFWREKLTIDDKLLEKEKDHFLFLPYDMRLREPHAAISGIIGATCEAWLSGRKSSKPINHQAKERGHFGADLFGSACYTFQRGKFTDLTRDLTRIDARLDIGSASALARKLFKGAQSNPSTNLLASPRLNLIFQQQVYGPIVFRVDSKLALINSSGKALPELEDVRLSLNYSLRALHSGKVVAWYSPKRKEGMIELRVFEF